MSNAVKKHHEPLIHITKRDDMIWWKAWLIRLAAVLLGLLVVGVISVLLTKGNFFETYSIMLRGAFGRLGSGSTRLLWKFLLETALLLCLSLALTPAFKMKFWNCGAEGQALIGGLAAAIVMMKLGDKLPYWVVILLIFAAGILAGAVWGIVPALFKAQYKTNETLFTLMMNYIAMQLVAYYAYVNAVPAGSGQIQSIANGHLPVIGGQPYLLTILLALILTGVMLVYLKYSKHGYEISVVGESQNTARYIGINVKKVIIRTMMISGALCGLAGCLMVAGIDHSVNPDTVGGLGFTAIMVAWLGQLNPLIIVLMSGLIVFLESGAAKVADTFYLNGSYADIVAGIVILFVVGCEFFIRYSIKFRHKEGKA
ncbi:MAG: ABC transporter permease [Clostridia bacterium]|nr:ABC transporter permease [Clostridia bacterium]